jgi:hypothetical protein
MYNLFNSGNKYLDKDEKTLIVRLIELRLGS